jgi:hypothetical protein
MSLSARRPSGSFTSDATTSDTPSTANQTANQFSSVAGGLPPRRPSNGGTVTSSGSLLDPMGSTGVSRRSSMNDELELSGASGAIDALHAPRDLSPPPLVTPPINVTVSLSPKVTGDRKISPRPSQYRDGRGVDAVSGDSRVGDSVSVLEASSTEPPVYSGFGAGSNLRKKSVIASSTKGGSGGGGVISKAASSGGGVSPITRPVSGEVNKPPGPRRTVLSFNEGGMDGSATSPRGRS